MSLRITHVSLQQEEGGAAVASLRIHRALRSHAAGLGVDSHLRVRYGLGGDPSIEVGPPQGANALWLRLQPRLTAMACRGFVRSYPITHSIAWPSTGLGRELNRNGSDLIHLHWLGDQMISIEEIGCLKQPLVWTLHDQWAFCGAEHYTCPPQPGESASNDERFANGYSQTSRPSHESGPDLNRRTWLRKRRSWLKRFPIVCPSIWLAECARRSSLMRDWPITVIPYPIDLNTWAPCDQIQARQLLGLPCDRPLVLFGADSGTSDTRKGSDLLLAALQILHNEVCGTRLQDLELMVFGQTRPVRSPVTGFPIRYCGCLHDDLSLRLLYAAADVFVIPSRQDNLPNTGLEAHACGTPVVAFATGGLVDIVDHHVTGALADPFDPLSLAKEIHWVLDDQQRRRQLAVAARQRAELLWDPARVAGMYAEVYERSLQIGFAVGS